MSSRAFSGLLGAEDSVTLLRANAALRRLPEDAQRTMLSASGQQLAAGWGEELGRSSAWSPQQRAIVAGGPKAVATAIGLDVATGGSGKLGPLTRAWEFGSLQRETFRRYLRRGPSGVKHSVNRRTSRQVPPRSQTGWIAYPAAGRLRARVGRMFQQILVKASHDAVEGGER